MSKIRVLADHVANQIAAGEVVERPASVAKELVENSIDAGARRIEIDVEAGGRRLLRVSDDGEGMTRDDAVLAFERHATSKINTTEDLDQIRTLGFRGEALASVASVARVELITQTEDGREATRVLIEGGRMRDVVPAARPRGTTISARDLFFNVPARRKFLRSEATESFHLTNLVTHYALAHPEIAFVLTNNGREVLRTAPASNLRERAYQIFGEEFLESLLEVDGGHEAVAVARGYVSSPRERRTSRDAQYLFVNGRFVRDRLISRALTEGYRSVLPHGVYPAALLFLEVPLEEVDVNVHPAKTEVRFRRASVVADAVRDAVRAALATGGYVRAADTADDWRGDADQSGFSRPRYNPAADALRQESIEFGMSPSSLDDSLMRRQDEARGSASSPSLATPPPVDVVDETPRDIHPFALGENPDKSDKDADARLVSDTESTPASRETQVSVETSPERNLPPPPSQIFPSAPAAQFVAPSSDRSTVSALPPLVSAAGIAREVTVESLTKKIRLLGQLEDSFIIATDPEGLLLIDQHVAHERILFDKYRALEAARTSESQNLLVPETFDLTPAQAAAFDTVADELESYGFALMRLSGRTVAIKAVPADLPPSEARNILAEVLETIDAERRGAARATLRDEIAASLACRAAIKINMPLTEEKMRWLIDRLLTTSSPTTCPHGRPIILRLKKRDIERAFHRP
ncbi:MAG TPA: DNA mismatch repair endonuclease MutL [Pyrinomonadaceae bacterium]|jgi:DNA mismatch repair protein MutL|nr:DNA mismatch repair endonuclease MutL [Pyrinomonadaceae bacterium]